MVAVGWAGKRSVDNSLDCKFGRLHLSFQAGHLFLYSKIDEEMSPRGGRLSFS